MDKAADLLKFPATGPRAESPAGSPEASECQACHGTGWAAVEGSDGHLGARRCACAVGRLQETRIAAIPERFAACSLKTYAPRSKSQAAAKAAIAGNPRGSYCMLGPYGCGKTHLLYAQYRLMATSFDVRPLVRTTKQLVTELTRAELDAKFVSPVLEALESSVRLHLLWDDCDKLKVTDFKLEVLFELVDSIYRRNLGLTLTSNLPLDAPDHRDLQEKLDPAIVRRIPEICTVLEF